MMLGPLLRPFAERLFPKCLAAAFSAVIVASFCGTPASADDPSGVRSASSREPVEAPQAILLETEFVEPDRSPEASESTQDVSSRPVLNLAEIVNRKLAAAGLGPYAINVKAFEGDVTLDGHVQDEPAKRRAGRIAEQVEGVRSILNRLMIRHANDHADARHRDRKTHEGGATSSHDRKKRGLVNVNVVVTVNVQSGNVLGPRGPADHPGHAGPPEERRPEPESRHHIERLEGVLREREQAIQELKRELDRLRQQVEDRERNERNEQQQAESRERFEKMRQEALERLFRQRREAPSESASRPRDESQERLEDWRRQREQDERNQEAGEAEALREAFESRRREQRREAEQREAEERSREQPNDERREDEEQASRSPLSKGELVQFVTSLFQ